jgi:hypothetical protein
MGKKDAMTQWRETNATQGIDPQGEEPGKAAAQGENTLAGR